MVGVGAFRGASLCRRIKRKQWGVNGWLRARTKRGAGSMRRVGIQILSGKMSPLSVGYIGGRQRESERERERVGTTEKLPVTGEHPGQDSEIHHHGLLALHLDCSISFHGDGKGHWSIWSRSRQTGIYGTVPENRGWVFRTNFTHGRVEALEARGRGHAPGAVCRAGGALARKHTRSRG